MHTCSYPPVARRYVGKSALIATPSAYRIASLLPNRGLPSGTPPFDSAVRRISPSTCCFVISVTATSKVTALRELVFHFEIAQLPRLRFVAVFCGDSRMVCAKVNLVFVLEQYAPIKRFINDSQVVRDRVIKRRPVFHQHFPSSLDCPCWLP